MQRYSSVILRWLLTVSLIVVTMTALYSQAPPSQPIASAAFVVAQDNEDNEDGDNEDGDNEDNADNEDGDNEDNADNEEFEPGPPPAPVTVPTPTPAPAPPPPPAPAPPPPPPPPPVTQVCEFRLGFETLKNILDVVAPEARVGICLENEHWIPETSTSQQLATGGLFVWRQEPNLSYFTNGFFTWINSPIGIVRRLNTERFCFEPGAGPCIQASDNIIMPLAEVQRFLQEGD